MWLLWCSFCSVGHSSKVSVAPVPDYGVSPLQQSSCQVLVLPFKLSRAPCLAGLSKAQTSAAEQASAPGPPSVAQTGAESSASPFTVEAIRADQDAVHRSMSCQEQERTSLQDTELLAADSSNEDDDLEVEAFVDGIAPGLAQLDRPMEFRLALS